MKNFIIFLLFLCNANIVFSQFTLREHIINADTIVNGFISETAFKVNKSYYSDGLCVVSKDLKDTLNILPGMFLFEVNEYFLDETRDYDIYFLKKLDSEYYYVLNWTDENLEEFINEMLKINNIKSEEEKFNKTVEWLIQILENKSCSENFYNELDENNLFIKYYKKIGIVSSLDNVLTTDQKKRVLSGLINLDNWGYSEIELASLIYKEYPDEIEKHIIHIIEKQLKSDLFHSWDLERLLNIMNPDNQNKEIISILNDLKSADKCKYEIMNKGYKNLLKIINK